MSTCDLPNCGFIARGVKYTKRPNNTRVGKARNCYDVLEAFYQNDKVHGPLVSYPDARDSFDLVPLFRIKDSKHQIIKTRPEES